MQEESVNKGLVKFIVAAVLFFGWGVIQGALQAQEPIHNFIDETINGVASPAAIIVGAHVHINLLGWVSLTVAAATYYLIPLLTGKPIVATRLIKWIFWIWVTTLALMGILMISAGIVGGRAFEAGVTGSALDSRIAPFMASVGILSIILALNILAFVGQILVSIKRKTS